MARQNHGPLTKARGRIGGVVYQQYEGRQYAREYQPVVLNPNTDYQMINRAKFKAASQFSALWMNIFDSPLKKYSSYERYRRGFLVASGYRNASVNTQTIPGEGSLYTATINGQAVTNEINNAISVATNGAVSVVFTNLTQTIQATTESVFTMHYRINAFNSAGTNIGTSSGSLPGSLEPVNMDLPLLPLGVTAARYDVVAWGDVVIPDVDNSDALTVYNHLQASTDTIDEYDLNSIVGLSAHNVAPTRIIWASYMTT